MRFKILLARPRKWKPGSWLIMKVQGLPFSHCAIQLMDGYVRESVWPEARRISELEWRSHYRIVEQYEYVIAESKYCNLRDVLQEYMGTKYSILQLAIIALGQTIKPLEKLLGKVIWNGKKRLICTELGLIALETALDYKPNEEQDMFDLVDIRVAAKEISNGIR